MPHDLRALTRQWFEVVWNQKNASGIAQLAAPDAIVHGLDESGSPGANLDTFQQFYQAFLSAFPDIHVDIEDVLLEGDKTAVRLRFNGTHKGGGIGIEPTGRTFLSTAICIIRWKDGKIIEAWNEFDASSMVRQLQAPTAKLKQ